MILEYSDKIPQKIPLALKTSLDLRVSSLKNLKGGEVNYSFRAETNKGPVLVRIFRYEGWPIEENLRFIEEKLDALKIRQSKIIYFDHSNKYFLNGFMVGEWIEGMQGKEALKKGVITEDKILVETAKILKRVHTVTFDNFGRPPFDQKNKGVKDFASFILDNSGEDKIEDLIKDHLVTASLIKDGRRLLKNLLERINFPIKPVLVHGDATPDNVILTKQGPVLIDWEDAKANSWVFEFAFMTFYAGEKVREPFLRGYGNHPNSTDQMRLLENIFHLQLALKNLPYNAYALQDKKRLVTGIKKLEELIENIN